MASVHERSIEFEDEGSAMPPMLMKVRATKAVAVVALASISLLGVVGAVARSQPVAAAGTTGCQPTASTPVPQPTQAQLDAAGLGDLPLAPDSARRDLVAEPFEAPDWRRKFVERANAPSA